MQLRDGADESIGGVDGRAPGQRRCHGAGRVCVDRRQQRTAWLTVTAAASGTGNGTVAFSAAANPTTHAAHRHADDRGPDVHREPGGAACSYTLVADEPIGAVDGRRRVDRR